MAEHGAQQEAGEHLRHLTKTDPDPRVRGGAHAVLLAAEGPTLARVARLLRTGADRVHVWQERVAAAGRVGVLDRPRGALALRASS